MPSALPLPAELRSALQSVHIPGAVHIVGGFVRDLLLGRDSPDLDLVVKAHPERVARKLAAALDGSAFPLGAEHGVFRVTLPSPVAGLLHIDVALRRGGLEHDLSLRDFTVNAIAIPVHGGTLVDPTGGVADLHAGVLRLVSDTAVQDDPLRALRAVRFAAELSLHLDTASEAIIRRDAPLLSRSAGERQRDELMRVLDTPVAASMLRLADRLGILAVVLPELIPSKGCEQPKEHYYDVFDHQIETVAVLDCILSAEPFGEPCVRRYDTLWAGIPAADELYDRYNHEVAEGRTFRALLKLVGLLHDVSKPETKAHQPDGRMRFFGHPELGARVATVALERLRFTARENRLAALLIEEHLRPGQLSDGRTLPSRRALYRFFRDLGDGVMDVLLLNIADHTAARGPLMTEDEWNGHAAYVGWILGQQASEVDLVRPARLVTGHDLMRELDVPPGPLLGRLLAEVAEEQAEGTVRTREQALAFARDLLARAAVDGDRDEVEVE